LLEDLRDHKEEEESTFSESKGRVTPTYEEMQDTVRKGMIAVEAGLFDHATTEYSRIPRLREALDTLEDTILSAEFIQQMKSRPKNALKMYTVVRQILDNSVKFLQETHDMALKQHEVQKLLEAIEKLSGSPTKKVNNSPGTDQGLLEAVRKATREYYNNKQNK